MQSAEMVTYGRNPARQSPDALVRAHMPLVRRIAWHVHARVASAIEIEDLVQIGMVALIEAAKAYEDRGHAFATYAQMRVRGAMIDRLRASAGLCRSALAKRRQLAATRSKLEQGLARHASDAEMAAALGLDAAGYRAFVDSAISTTHESIDEVYSDHAMWFASNDDDAEEAIDKAQMKQAVAAAIRSLPEREALVLQLYFVEELNLEEIRQVLGVTAARVCQIKKAALDKVRALLTA